MEVDEKSKVQFSNRFKQLTYFFTDEVKDTLGSPLMESVEELIKQENEYESERKNEIEREERSKSMHNYFIVISLVLIY